MCLIVLAHQQHPNYPLIIAANRDELYARPSAGAQLWQVANHRWWGGKDLQAGGSWLGLTHSGRWAAVTNLPGHYNGEPKFSRGELVTGFLHSPQGIDEYARQTASRGQSFNGFNLLLGDHDALFYLNNATNEPRKLLPGIYGLSNHLLDQWPKVERAKTKLASLLNTLNNQTLGSEPLLNLLADTTQASAAELQQTTQPTADKNLQQRLSSIFIAEGAAYGTCSSIAITVDKQGKVNASERRFYQQPYSQTDDEFYLTSV